MTEQNKKNNEVFLDLCKTVWDFDEPSLSYIKNRISDEWHPVSEFNELLKDKDFTDQRIRFDIDMSNPTVQDLFSESDEAYKLFTSSFENAITYLRNKYSCKIGYNEFITNKCVFKKNVTKIKKVFEVAYAENTEGFEGDFVGISYTPEKCTAAIVKKFEKIGASKKSAKKLQMVVSFNPVDWLMSSTSESWSSCFNINNDNNGGFQYCLGLPFQCGDKNRVMIYITDGSKKECMGMTVDHFQTRTWAILGNNDLVSIVKWYPNNTVGIEPVSSITGCNLFTSEEEFSEGKYPIDVLSTVKGAVINVYSDMGTWKEEKGQLKLIGNDKSGQQIFSKNLIRIRDNMETSLDLSMSRTSNYYRFSSDRVGYRIPRWKELGIHLDMFFPERRCSCCHENKVGIFGRDYICFDCYKENAYSCYNCDGTYMKNKNPPVEVITTNNEKVMLCPSCYKENHVCDCCHRYEMDPLRETTDGKHICPECIKSGKSGYSYCQSCSNLTKNIVYKYNTFDKFLVPKCKRCSEAESDNDISSAFEKYETVINSDGRFSLLPE